MYIDSTAYINDAYTLILDRYYNTSLGTQTLEFKSRTEFNQNNKIMILSSPSAQEKHQLQHQK